MRDNNIPLQLGRTTSDWKTVFIVWNEKKKKISGAFLNFGADEKFKISIAQNQMEHYSTT